MKMINYSFVSLLSFSLCCFPLFSCGGDDEKDLMEILGNSGSNDDKNNNQGDGNDGNAEGDNGEGDNDEIVLDYNGHEAVDLGLSVKWAASDMSGYYAWGETEEKDCYDWNHYKYCEGSSTTLTKYCLNSRYGIVDNKVVLEPEDDAAHVQWGGKWRMPTAAEYEELRNKCIWTIDSYDSYNLVITSANGNKISFSMKGKCRLYESYHYLYDGAYYLLSSLGKGGNAVVFQMGYAHITLKEIQRFGGFCIRPVWDDKDDVLKDDEPWDVGKQMVETDLNDHEAVDLGLPSGTLWATCNVDASSPKEYGGYYAWGETEEKYYYRWMYYKHLAWDNTWEPTYPSSFSKYCTDPSYGTVDNKTVLDLEDDVAHVKWGGSWRMPTYSDFEELDWFCRKTKIDNGYEITGPNGNSIYLPIASFKGENGKGYWTYPALWYWSSSLTGPGDTNAGCFYCSWNNTPRSYSAERRTGFPVRPVTD